MRNKLFLIAMSVLALTGCSNNETELDEVVVDLPAHGYILFDTPVPTRGELVSDMNRNFGVMGYSWDYNDANDVWNTVKVQAKPNEFHKQKVTYDPASNLHSYDARPAHTTALVPWKPSSKYSFFGYYPHETEANGAITLSGANEEGTPYLTYTLPSTPASMLDVMTASLYNTDYKTAREVALNFEHRLAAVDIQMINLNAKFGGKDVYVKLTDLKMNFTNLKYNKAKIWMDYDMGMERTVASTSNQKKSYTMSNSLTIAPTDLESGTLTIATTGNPLILIPQEVDATTQALKGTITFNLAYVDSNGNSITLNDAEVKPGAHTHDIDFEGDLAAKRKHIVQLTFTRDAVTVQIVPPSEWTDNDIDIEFD